MTITELADEIWSVNDKNGWNNKKRSPLEMHALFHSEVSEATECVRNGEDDIWFNEDGKPEGEAIECTDILIRVIHYMTIRNWDIEHCINTKLDYNRTRPFRHNNKKY